LIGLDTNVLVRYLAQDDKAQAAAATDLIENEFSKNSPGYLNHITLCEIVWVLKKCYKVTKPKLIEIIEGLMSAKQLLIEDVALVWKALKMYESNNIDFSDALISNINTDAGCVYTVTFDKQAAKLKGFESLGK